MTEDHFGAKFKVGASHSSAPDSVSVVYPAVRASDGTDRFAEYAFSLISKQEAKRFGFELVLASSNGRCDRCHHHAPTQEGCTLCNPEELGRRLAAALDTIRDRENLIESMRGGTKTIIGVGLPLLERIEWICSPKKCGATETVGMLEAQLTAPIRMVLSCPMCGKRHIDEGEFATKSHHTHACQHCGLCWRPAVQPTFGVQFLPGFKDK